jgi:hypothetical protein
VWYFDYNVQDIADEILKPARLFQHEAKVTVVQRIGEMPEEVEDENDVELRRTMNGNVAYADGCTIDEMAEAVETADKPESEQSPEAVETLYRLSKTDMFEQLVSGDAGRAARIAAILDRGEQSLAGQREDAADDSDGKYRDFDIGQFLS